MGVRPDLCSSIKIISSKMNYVFRISEKAIISFLNKQATMKYCFLPKSYRRYYKWPAFWENEIFSGASELIVVDFYISFWGFFSNLEYTGNADCDFCISNTDIPGDLNYA